MTTLNIDTAMQTAIQHHRAGRLAEAERIYRQVLGAQPDHPDALHLLGVVATRCGHLDGAAELIRKAIAIKPTAQYYNDLGMVWVSRGSMEEAAAAFEESVRLNPWDASALNSLGIALAATGRIHRLRVQPEMDATQLAEIVHERLLEP